MDKRITLACVSGISPWVMETSRLHREYLDEVLRRLATEAEYEPPGWDSTGVALFRLVDQCAYAAVTEADLRSLRSYLRMQPYPQAGPRAWLVVLGSHRSLVITIKAEDIPMTALFELLNAGTEALR